MFKQTLLAAALAAATIAAPVQAAELLADGQWQAFDVDDLIASDGGLGWIDLDGDPLSFTFTLTGPAVLRVVDAGFGGDRFTLINQAGSLPVSMGETSPVPVQEYDDTAIGIVDFDLAYADHANFSYAEFVLGAGSYDITGVLTQSVLFNGVPLNATIGGIQLTAVPLPASGLLLLGASGLLGAMRRRQS